MSVVLCPAPEPARAPPARSPRPCPVASLVIPAVHGQERGYVVLVAGTKGATRGPPHGATEAVLPQRSIDGGVCHCQRRMPPVEHKPLAARAEGRATAGRQEDGAMQGRKWACGMPQHAACGMQHATAPRHCQGHCTQQHALVAAAKAGPPGLAPSAPGDPVLRHALAPPPHHEPRKIVSIFGVPARQAWSGTQQKPVQARWAAATACRQWGAPAIGSPAPHPQLTCRHSPGCAAPPSDLHRPQGRGAAARSSR